MFARKLSRNVKPFWPYFA